VLNPNLELVIMLLELAVLSPDGGQDWDPDLYAGRSSSLGQVKAVVFENNQ
jgi:hypothetical protein